MLEDDVQVPPIPTLLAVATPPHMLYVPWQLWGVNLGVLLGGGALGGAVFGGGLRLEFSLPVALGLHAWFTIRYRRDPHLWGVWRTRLMGRPIAGITGRRHRFGLPRRIRFAP